jgi:anti-sigma factor RsiW
MRPDASRLAAFVDGELGLDEQLAVEAQLREDAALRAELDAVRALREGVKRQADYHAAPAALRQFAAGLVRGSQAASPPSRPRGPRWGAWLSALRPGVMVPGLAGAALALVLSFGFLQLQTAGEDEALAQQAVAGHVRASLSQHRVDVVSSERHTVKPWLSARLDYSPPVPELQRPGLVFEGGRVDYLDGRAVAVLVYHQGAHQVDLYVWPSEHGPSRPAITMVKGFRVARWSHGGMERCVVSDVNGEEFAALVSALQEAGDTP